MNINKHKHLLGVSKSGSHAGPDGDKHRRNTCVEKPLVTKFDIQKDIWIHFYTVLKANKIDLEFW